MINNLKDFFGFNEESEETVETFRKEENPKAEVAPQIKPFKATVVQNPVARLSTSMEIKIEEPRVYEDSLGIATQLRENIPVIVNLKYLDSDSSKRLVDFICGTAYAINGHMMKVGENIFLFAPSNVHISNPEDRSSFEKGLELEEKPVFFRKIVG